MSEEAEQTKEHRNNQAQGKMIQSRDAVNPGCMRPLLGQFIVILYNEHYLYVIYYEIIESIV